MDQSRDRPRLDTDDALDCRVREVLAPEGPATRAVASMELRFQLEVGEVHVWSLCLDRPGAALRSLAAAISAEEAARAKRFHFAADRWRYVAAHGHLRRVLAGYLGTRPERIAFDMGAGGKPCLADFHALRFNLSHAGGLAVVAVCAGREVGVDVELIRDDADLDRVAEICFSPAERAAFAVVPIRERPWAFFAGWTRKEAFLKALGVGLARPLDSFDVTLTPGEPARLLRVHGSPARHALRTFEPAPGYIGAVAVDMGAAWSRD